MATTEGKGSILLKLLIVILVVLLVIVIILPGKIWKNEAQEQKTAQDNISSIYEAEKFYHRINGKYTDQPAELLKSIRMDSTLLQQQQVVNYTNELARVISSFLHVNYIKAIIDINQNMRKIQEDIHSNRRNFSPPKYENIKNEAEELKMKIGEINGSHDFSNYVESAAYLDSLVQLKQNMSDYTLQICASRAKNYTDTLQSILGNIDVASLSREWSALSERIDKFIKMVKHSDLVYVTSVGDRIKDFKNAVDLAFEKLQKIDKEADLAQSAQSSKKLDEIYQKFLNDFTITSKFALYKLSEADSMILHLTEDNFSSPVSNEQYKFIFNDDSTAIKIESPVLLNEVRAIASPLAAEIRSLPVMNGLQAYADSLQALKEKAYKIRKKIRKNTDLFIKYKEIESLVDEFGKISMYNAYNGCRSFAYEADSTESYSDLHTYTEDALNGVRIFKQAYTENFFGNLDSLHRDLQVAISDFDSLLSSVRRLPKGIENLEQDGMLLDQLLQDIKNAGSPELKEKLAALEEKLGELYLFESEGKEITVYGVFNKKLKNFGYIFQDSKSWEEKDNN